MTKTVPTSTVETIHDRINALCKRARQLAPKAYAEALDTGCTNKLPTGPRQREAWLLSAVAFALNGQTDGGSRTVTPEQSLAAYVPADLIDAHVTTLFYGSLTATPLVELVELADKLRGVELPDQHHRHVRWLSHQYALHRAAAELEACRRYVDTPHELVRWNREQGRATYATETRRRVMGGDVVHAFCSTCNARERRFVDGRCTICRTARDDSSAPRVYATGRDESESCERLTFGCSIDHTNEPGDRGCEVW